MPFRCRSVNASLCHPPSFHGRFRIVTKKTGSAGPKTISHCRSIPVSQNQALLVPFTCLFLRRLQCRNDGLKKKVGVSFGQLHHSPTIAVLGMAYLIKHILETFLCQRTALDVFDGVKILGKLLSLLELYH